MKLALLLALLAGCGGGEDIVPACRGLYVRLQFAGETVPTWDPAAYVLDVYLPASAPTPSARYLVDPAGAADHEVVVPVLGPGQAGVADVNAVFSAASPDGTWRGSASAALTGLDCQEVEVNVALAAE